MPVSHYFRYPVISFLKAKAVRLSNMKAIQPEYTQFHHSEIEFRQVYISLHFIAYTSVLMLAICDLFLVLCEFNATAKMQQLYHTMCKLFTLIINRINYVLKSCTADAISKYRNYIKKLHTCMNV
jgi:hypothetical protein